MPFWRHTGPVLGSHLQGRARFARRAKGVQALAYAGLVLSLTLVGARSISGVSVARGHTGPVPSSRQYALAGAGVLLVAIGAVGVVVPGLPTTIFLLGASWCFARSIPWLEQRLLRNRFFGPYMRILDGEEPMTNRARITTIATIWLAVSLSCWLLHRSGRLANWLFIVLMVAALIGSVVVWHFRRSVARVKQAKAQQDSTKPEPADPS